MMATCSLSATVLGTLLIWIFLPHGILTESCLQHLEGQVGSGNYTYYRLDYEGDVTLTLHSIQGDSDVYVSQHTLQPTFDLDSHDLQSVTCDADRVDIPSSFQRPVGIGIYGYSSIEISRYELCVNVVQAGATAAYDYNSYVDEPESEHSDKPSRPHVPFHYEKDEEEESLLWAILIGILKVFVEVFM